jgi:steroid delta-isomerase-like uncharacterized protein
MSQQANKAVVHRFIEELWNQRKLALADDLFVEDCITHQLRFGSDPAGAPRGPAAMKHHVADWLAAFPDIRFAIEQTLAEGDRVMTQCIARGTHLGSWLGIPATGKFISIQMFVVHRIADGLIAEDWVLVDSLGVFQQLGLVPPSEELLAQASLDDGRPRTAD